MARFVYNATSVKMTLEKLNEAYNELENTEMDAYEYRMEAHKGNVIIGDSTDQIQINPEEELDKMTQELLNKYQ